MSTYPPDRALGIGTNREDGVIAPKVDPSTASVLRDLARPANTGINGAWAAWAVVMWMRYYLGHIGPRLTVQRRTDAVYTDAHTRELIPRRAYELLDANRDRLPPIEREP